MKKLERRKVLTTPILENSDAEIWHEGAGKQ